MQRVVKNSDDLQRLYAFLGDAPHPFTFSFVAGEKRSNPQNALMHKWYAELSKQRGDVTPETVRAECKLQFGVPIMRRDDAEFRSWYDETIKPLPYEVKVRLFEMLDPAVTSKMTVGQLTEYLDNMGRFYREAGFYLTDPELRKYGDMA